MSQKDDSENDIWDYKPLEKKKKRQKSPSAATTVTKRRCTSRKTSKRATALSVKKAPERAEKVKTAEGGDCGTVVNVNGHSSRETPSKLAPINETVQTHNAAEGPSSGDFCPMCQMPFSILVVQSQRWHVAECLDIPRDKCQECPDGLQCSSTIPNHFKKFNHTLLAHSRANSDTALLSLSEQAETSGESSLSCLPGLINNEVDDSSLETSQDSAVSLSVSSPLNKNTGTPPSKLTNGLLFLRSPGPEDFKKKKGWSSSAKGHKPISASQESKTELSSTPVKEDWGGQACEGFPKSEPSPENDDIISYSPLSEFPAETEVNNSECRKVLFNDDAFENEDEDSMELFNDGFSSEDELLTQFIDNLDSNNVPVKDLSSSNTQLESITSLAPTNQLAVAENRADCTGGKGAHGKSSSAISACKTSIQSPQSIVLERLRETLLSSDNLCSKNLNDSIQSEQSQANSHQVPSSQTSTVQRPQSMPLQKGQSKTGQASGLKQTDIGVFFGLKPLKEKEKEAKSGPNELNTTSVPALVENSGQRRQRRERQRRSKVDTTTDTSQGMVTVDSNDVGNAQGKTSRDWRRSRWNRVNADGEVELQRCPFYKKIPGTKFVIDAFRYGEIEGITAYFLTHFHSDHYGGLTKNATVPIYCNRITGNLVKSKLKVAEQYVHILPMNTPVTVDGVRVILLDANHCPGAAMLLFFLPDGQTVLHTGDFRADPSMETYPELLSCRVQTLYLDTTYCSPQYTFPRQQEVINFAASTAFELVTLNPRTLVVCGSYSVGKEKVFLALAEVLGSKVCLSRDKYNTMCCLESEQVRQRITTDWKAAQVHVLPMMQLSFKEVLLKRQQHLQRQTDVITYRMKKLAAKQEEITKKSNAVKEKIRKKYEDMKRVLDEDLRITLTQLDTEHEATEKLVEERIEDCYQLTQELNQELDNLRALVKKDTQDIDIQNAETEKRVSETLKLTDPDLIQMDEFKNEQLLSITINLLLFIRSQVPVTKKLFQSYAADVVLDADTAHPKLIISPEGDSATYTDTWQDVPETPSRFDNTLNVISKQGFSEGRQYWEVEVSGKSYWELGLTYPGIPRQGREEDCWLGRGKESWCVEYFNGNYAAWHGGVQHELPLLAGKQFTRIGVYCSFPGGLVCFLGADTMTPLHCFCAGTFADTLYQALCPGHDNEGTNWKALKICDASRSAPVL